MKQYNLNAVKRQMSFGELTVIALGEKGRGRCENFVPFQGDISNTDCVVAAPTQSGKVKIIRGGDTTDWIARISCQGCYTRGTSGYAYVTENDSAKVSVLAYGNGAEGDAGRIGYWADYLLLIQDGTLIKVKQHGGHKTPPYYLYFGAEGVAKIEEEEFPLWLDANPNYSETWRLIEKK